MDSEDSDFYGDDDGVANLLARVDRFDTSSWLALHALHPGRPVPRPTLPPQTSNLHNPYAGIPFAWQLTETVDAFLTRLSPRTTIQTPQTPWIFICNPYIQRNARGEDSGHGSEAAEKGKGNEDEAPSESGSKVGLVVEAGMERLELVTKFVEKTKTLARNKTAAEKEMDRERKQAVSDILTLAHAAKVRAGKWMLFCSEQDVNEVWGIIAHATASNELGIAAKVAPKPADADSRRDRLVCVYTADFKDKADVGRVLNKLRQLKLVESRARAIYYKPDAFTYIGIASGNPWGVRASIYSSMDTFPQ